MYPVHRGQTVRKRRKRKRTLNAGVVYPVHRGQAVRKRRKRKRNRRGGVPGNHHPQKVCRAPFERVLLQGHAVLRAVLGVGFRV